MPAILEACVLKVQAQGFDKQSAYAICNASLGLDEPGANPNGVDPDMLQMTEAEMEARLKRNPEYMKRLTVDPATPAEPAVKPEAPMTPAPVEPVVAASADPAKVAAAVPVRPDVSPQSGVHQYGPDTSTPFADEMNNKYPIDTEAHIRSAWNYINQADNAAKYDASAVAAIKNKIVAAWKKHIDPQGPPSVADQTPPKGAVVQGFTEAERLRQEVDMVKPFVKDIIVARVGKNFVNGKQAFDLTAKNIDEIITNFGVLQKQVPLILTPDHVFGGRKSAIPAAGWVEKMYRSGADWHAVVKFVGEAATLVANDQFRGVSIGTVMARDVHGREVGEALDHLLLTNAPFFDNLNIAASESAASIGRVRYICATEAQEKEPAMADPVITPEAMEVAVKAAVTSRDEDIVRLTRENITLAEENGRLQSQLKDYASPAEKKILTEKILELREVAFVAQVRALVHRGLVDGRFAPVWCKGYDGKDALDNAGTIRWFRASKFYNSSLPNPDEQAFHFLRFASETYPPLYRMGQTHASGTPLPGIGRQFTMNPEEKQALTAKGFDPERVAAVTDDMTYEEWKSQVGVAKETK